jgi:hypothetical protein
LGGRDKEEYGLRQAKAKFSPSQKASWLWWFMPVISATQEAQVGGSQSWAGPRGKRYKTLSEI